MRYNKILIVNCQEKNCFFIHKKIKFFIDMNEDRLLTKEETAKYLHISRATLSRLMKEIPYIKLGRRVLFKMSDIDKYLESKKVK